MNKGYVRLEDPFYCQSCGRYCSPKERRTVQVRKLQLDGPRDPKKKFLVCPSCERELQSMSDRMTI